MCTRSPEVLRVVLITAKTSGDSGPGVSHDIFRPIQDSFTTQETQGGMAWGLEISLACEALVARPAETVSDQAR